MVQVEKAHQLILTSKIIPLMPEQNIVYDIFKSFKFIFLCKILNLKFLCKNMFVNSLNYINL